MLNMQVSFTIGSCDDAARAQRIVNAICDEYNGPEADVLDTPQPASTEARPAARRPRTPRVAAAADPVAAYNDKAAEKGVAPIPEAPIPEPEPEQPPTADAEPEAPADTRTTDELLAALRDMARAKGGAWLRPILEKHGVDKLSSLTDDQKRTVLAS